MNKRMAEWWSIIFRRHPVLRQPRITCSVAEYVWGDGLDAYCCCGNCKSRWFLEGWICWPTSKGETNDGWRSSHGLYVAMKIATVCASYILDCPGFKEQIGLRCLSTAQTHVLARSASCRNLPRAPWRASHLNTCDSGAEYGGCQCAEFHPSFSCSKLDIEQPLAKQRAFETLPRSCRCI